MTPVGRRPIDRITGTLEVPNRLFVYGTMRAGQTARALVANSITRMIPATARGRIYAFPMGYPGFVEGDDGEVVGELLWLGELAGTFALLDAYEGADFARTLIEVTSSEGEQVAAWIYKLANPSTVSLGTLIEDGDWVRYWNEQD